MFECCFLSLTGRVVINKGENKFTDFRKVNDPVKCILLKIFSQKYSRKKHKTKFSKPPATANNHPVVVLEIYILEAHT